VAIYKISQEEQCVSKHLADFSYYYSGNVAYYLINYAPLVSNSLVWFYKDQILSNAKIRYSYKDKVTQLEEKFQARIDSKQEIDEDYARELFEQRNEIKKIERKKMDPKDLAILHDRNLKEYGNEEGPDFQYFRDVKKKSFAQIAESAGRIGGADLGLKSDMFKCLFNYYESENANQDLSPQEEKFIFEEVFYRDSHTLHMPDELAISTKLIGTNDNPTENY
jgi:hypothetical protein